MKSILFSLLLIFGIQLYSPGIILDVPGSYPTIQFALNSCNPGDTVLVQPGIYYENLTWPNINNLKLIGAGANAAATVVSASANGRPLYIGVASLDTNTVISNLTLTDGALYSSSGLGAGVYINNASVLLENVIITGNKIYNPTFQGCGAGLNLNNSSSVIRNCVISENSIDSAAWCYGAGIYISFGSPTLSNVVISDNSANAVNGCFGVGLYAGAVTSLSLNEIKVTNNISGNNAGWYYGNGIYLEEAVANLNNVLVASNVSGSGGGFDKGGGIYCDGTMGNIFMMNCTITENIKTGNDTISGSGIYVNHSVVTAVNCIFYNLNSGSEVGISLSGQLTIQWSDIRGGYNGAGNIDQIPGFVSLTDFHLTPNSPCAGTGTSVGAPFIDLDGTTRPLPSLTMPDMGCYEVDQSVNAISGNPDQHSGIRIYPNPIKSGQVINIEFDEKINSIKLFDNTSRIILDASVATNSFQLDTKYLNGIYLILINESILQKLIILK